MSTTVKRWATWADECWSPHCVCTLEDERGHEREDNTDERKPRRGKESQLCRAPQPRNDRPTRDCGERPHYRNQ